MTIEGTDWLVILAGLAAIAWVNWYFFIAGRSRAAAGKDGRDHARDERAAERARAAEDRG